MTDNRTFTPQPQLSGQSFEDWVRQQFEELARISQEGGQLSPLSIDLDNLADGMVVSFDATNYLWKATTISVPSELPPPDADYGDISVSGGVWSIDAGAVTYAKIQNVTADRLLGRTGTAGSIEELSLGTNLSFSGNTLNAEGGSKIIRNWGPTDASFPTSNYATLDTRNTHPVLDFATGAFKSCYFRGVFPDNYDGEDITITLFMTMTSATSGAVVMSTRIENMSGLDITSNSFTAGYPSNSASVPGTAGTMFELTTTLTGANLDSVAAGDPFRIEIARDTPSRAGDTATGDMELHMVEMRIQ